ncbi:MAG: fatty acid desaturase [Pseudomonadota bacterium]
MSATTEPSSSTTSERATAATATTMAEAYAKQGRIGLTLAALIIGGWLALHAYAMFVFAWSWTTAPIGIALMIVLTWLYVGMFIVAHDCMHGSLVPLKPAWNRWVGRICLGLYAGFSFDFMNRKHHLHHRHAGTEHDPDFLDHAPHAFWPWYAKFFREYFTGKEIIVIAAWVWTYMLVFDVPLVNIMTFLTVPAIVSSVQLFTFGTYLPHRPSDPAFADRHRSRSNDYPWWLSLLTCFHFGYHHEHHDVPDAPWWRLPQVRDAARQSGKSGLEPSAV